MSSPTEIRTPQRNVEHCMGTVFSIDVRAPGVDATAVDDVIAWLRWVDDTFSTYKHASQISRLGRGEISVDDCAGEVRQILDRCGELEEQTAGYFSVYASGQLDPSGLVKGWAIERASAMLRERGSLNHCVNGGGDVQCAGDATPAHPWRIGLAHPLQRGELVGIATGTGIAVATSGSAERGAHIIEPRSRVRPAELAELASVSLIGTELGTVDAYATAAFAMGADAPAWIENMSGLQGLVVFADGSIWSSPGLSAN